MYTNRDMFRAAAEIPVRLLSSVSTGWAGYLRSAARRDATPLDVALDGVAFCRAATRRRPTTFAHPNAVRRTWPLARLRQFSPTGSTTPTLVLPPLSGHASTVVDLAPGCSLMRTVDRAGLGAAHCLEWTPTGPQPPSVGIADLTAVITDAITELGGTANLVAYSQSGWLATVYAALHPHRVDTLTVAAAPIDFTLGAPASWLVPSYRGPGFRPPAAVRGAALRLVEWPDEWARLSDLWAHIHDRRRVDAYVAAESWLDSPQEVPADLYRWVARHLYERNELVRGELRVDGELVDLGAITCPLYLLAGTRDRIVPARQVWPLADHVSTAPDLVTRRTVDAGHLDMVLDPAVLERAWLPLLRDVAAKSRR